jgi:SAM-dependent methyltransferase
MADQTTFDAWQTTAHVDTFDAAAALGRWRWRWQFEGYNFTRLIRPFLTRITSITEIGCATGEYIRYLRAIGYGGSYVGYDISERAIQRARAKLPREEFLTVAPDTSSFRPADLVVAVDVAHHQPEPWSFLEKLLGAARGALLIRERTTDTHSSSPDWQSSCKYENGMWVPYMVLNTAQFVDFFLKHGAAEIIVARHYQELAGFGGRYLPKYLYGPQAKTALASMLVLRPTLTHSRERVTYMDRQEHDTRPLWLKTIDVARACRNVVR